MRDLVDYDGNHVSHKTYDSFGVVQDEGAVSILFGYTGRPVDDATGLQNNLHRWYDPAVGRWISEDPIGFGGGDANLYRYVGNQSTTRVDPSGLLTWEDYWVGFKAGTHEFFVGQIYGRGRSLVTGEAGKALGERAVGIVETQTRKPFTGTGSEYCRLGRGITGDLTGVNPLVEASYGFDISDERQLSGGERFERAVGGVAAAAGTVAGGVALVRVAGAPSMGFHLTRNANGGTHVVYSVTRGGTTTAQHFVEGVGVTGYPTGFLAEIGYFRELVGVPISRPSAALGSTAGKTCIGAAGHSFKAGIGF